MSAATALIQARAAGIQIGLDGEDLVLEAAAPPPRGVLDLLKRHKANLLALLRRRANWTAEDWQVDFDWRVAAMHHQIPPWPQPIPFLVARPDVPCSTGGCVSCGDPRPLRLIRFRGHLPKGGYDGTHGIKQGRPASAAAVQ